MRKTTYPTYVDLFAGAGLFGGAFRSAGFKLLRAVELNAIAAATHALNYPKGPIDVDDVTRLAPEGRCDVLIAGPPCQGFSTLGKRRADDPRNRLCLEVVRWAKTLKPSVIVVENVVPFLDSDAYVELRRQLRRQGYEIDGLILNALEYGVPQRRARSFTFASYVGLPELTTGKSRPITVREAWKGLPLHPDGVNGHTAPIPSPLALKRMRLIPAGGDKRDILRKAPELAPPSWHRTSCEVTDVWGRLEWDAPANTLRTCLLNPSKGRYIHPDQHRVLSLREAARLHSIDDNWKFVGTPYQVARQIGNSVPPRLGRIVARAVRRLVA